MRTALRSTALAAALVLLAVSADAANIRLKKGGSVTGKVTRYDESTKTLYMKTDAGKDIQLRMDEIDARSAYLVNASLVPDNDAQAQFMVANFARDAGLYAHAARRYGIAEKLDPKLTPAVDVEMTKLRKEAAKSCMSNARAAIAKGDFSDAERWLTAIVEKLPKQPEAEQASAMLDQHYAKVRKAKMAAADLAESAEMQEDSARAKQIYADMLENSKKGLQSRGGSEAQNYFNAALNQGKEVLREISRLEEKYPGAKNKEQADSYRSVVIGQMVDVHLHWASQLTVQTDYQGALQQANQALALDPTSQAALSARARIEGASSSDGRPWY